MILNFIFRNYDDNIEYGEIEVEEKTKTYKVIKVHKGRFYGSLISKNIINKVYDNKLIYTCLDEQAKEIWNNYINSEIQKIKEKIILLENEKLI